MVSIEISASCRSRLCSKSFTVVEDVSFGFIIDVSGASPKLSGVPQQPDAQGVLRHFGGAPATEVRLSLC